MVWKGLLFSANGRESKRLNTVLMNGSFNMVLRAEGDTEGWCCNMVIRSGYYPAGQVDVAGCLLNVGPARAREGRLLFSVNGG